MDPRKKDIQVDMILNYIFRLGLRGDVLIEVSTNTETHLRAPRANDRGIPKVETTQESGSSIVIRTFRGFGAKSL